MQWNNLIDNEVEKQTTKKYLRKTLMQPKTELESVTGFNKQNGEIKQFVI